MRVNNVKYCSDNLYSDWGYYRIKNNSPKKSHHFLDIDYIFIMNYLYGFCKFGYSNSKYNADYRIYYICA